MDTQKIRDEIAFWERERERCREDAGNQQGYNYYTGYVDGMKEILSFIETGELASVIEVRKLMQSGKKARV